LPPFDSLNRQRSYIEVFPIGTQPIHYHVAAEEPWIKLTDGDAASAGSKDRRIWVDIDWTKAPVGESTGTIVVESGERSDRIQVSISKVSDNDFRAAQGAFAIVNGPIAFNAQDAVDNVAVGNVRWEKIPDYGPGISAMSIFPVTAASIQSPLPAPHMNYRVYFAKAGDYAIDLVTNPTLDLYPGRGLSVGVSLDDGAPEVVDAFSGSGKADQTFLGREYQRNTRNNSRVMHFAGHVSEAGVHTVRITMVDPTIAVEKVVIHDRSLPLSYFGPPPATPVGMGSTN
jgi:hypothetical protein